MKKFFENYKIELALSILLFIILPLPILERIEYVDLLLDILRVCVLFFLAWIYYKNFMTHLTKPFNLITLVLWGYLLVITLINYPDSSFYTYFGRGLSLCCIICFTENFAVLRPKELIRSMYFLFSVYTVANTISVFLFPNGMYPNNRGYYVCWLLGEDNMGYAYYIIASSLAMVYDYYLKRKLSLLSLTVYISSFIFVFIRDIATGIICQIIWILLVCLIFIKGMNKILELCCPLFITVAGFILLIFIGPNIFSSFLSLLNRSTTLTGRTLIWETIMGKIMDNPIFGYGIYSNDGYAELILNGTGMEGIYNPHNLLLHLLFSGGIIGTFIFLISIYMSYYKNSAKKTSAFKFLNIGFSVYAIRGLVEAGNTNLALSYFFLCIIVYLPEVLKGLEGQYDKSKQ